LGNSFQPFADFFFRPITAFEAALLKPFYCMITHYNFSGLLHKKILLSQIWISLMQISPQKYRPDYWAVL
jgi:hypothetical protein